MVDDQHARWLRRPQPGRDPWLRRRGDGGRVAGGRHRWAETRPRLSDAARDLQGPAGDARHPSLIAVSGQKSGGLHVYWLLDQPYVIRGEADRRRIKDIPAAGKRCSAASSAAVIWTARTTWCARAAAHRLHEPQVRHRRTGGPRPGPGDEGQGGSRSGGKSR